MWKETQLCTIARAARLRVGPDHQDFENLRNSPEGAKTGAARHWSDGGENFYPTKGRPPPGGGEEAEVVVLQPRRVGLMHPRLMAE